MNRRNQCWIKLMFASFLKIHNLNTVSRKRWSLLLMPNNLPPIINIIVIHKALRISTVSLKIFSNTVLVILNLSNSINQKGWIDFH